MAREFSSIGIPNAPMKRGTFTESRDSIIELTAGSSVLTELERHLLVATRGVLVYGGVQEHHDVKVYVVRLQ